MCRGESLAYLKRSGGAFKGRTAAEVLRPIENARSEERGRAKLEAARQEMVKVVSDVLAFVRVPTEMFATLRQYADGMIKLDDPRSIDLALTDFRAKANEANNKYLTSLRQHKELAALRSELVELEGENIEAVRAMLDRVEKGQISITSSIRSTVKKARDQALQDGDRRYVATVMKQKLRDLGYQCDEDFETLFMDGGHIHIDVPDRNEPHVVELDVDPESNVFGAKVMRVSDKTEPIVYGVSQEAYETIQVEVKWCKDLANMLRALKDGGIECGIEEETFKDVGVKGTVVAVLPPNEKRRGRQRARGHVLKARELKNQ